MATLYDIYKSQGKALPGTVDERFADPNFASAAQQAGITKDQYKINSGNADYNTRIASLYGKTNTQTPNPTAVPSDSTPQSGAGYTYTMSPEEKALRDSMKNYVDIYNNDATQKIDPNEIYNNNLAQFQGQINALNKIYDDQINKARIEGQGRLESRKFSQGRSGQIGSGTGEAGVNAVQSANTDIENQINNERAAAIADIFAKVKTFSDKEFADKKAAKIAGADALLKFYDEAPTRRAAKLKPVIGTLLAKGIDPASLSQEELKSITDGIGATPEEIFSAYREGKAAADKAAAEAKKIENQSLPASAQEYEYAKRNGYTGSYTQYQTEDANRKRVAVNIAAPKETLSERHASTVANISQIFSPGAVIPNSGGTPFIDENGYATPEGFRTAMSAAAADGLSRTEFVKQFGYTIPTGLERNYGLTPAEIKLIIGELPAE